MFTKTTDLKTMNFELILLDESAADQQLADVLALVALQLQHLAVLGVVHHRPVTRELLLSNLDDLLEIVLVREPLHRRQGLPAVPLLDPDVHQPVLH